MIERLKLKNFTAFKDLSIDFSPKINVIIGENGTGKTHLLKAAYTLCAGSRALKDQAEVCDDDIKTVLSNLLLRTFLPIDDKFASMRHYDAEIGSAEMIADFISDKKIHVKFHTNSKSVNVVENNSYERYSWEPIFIPTKEVLSFMKGFNSLYEKYELSFDKTYQDICLLLDLPEARSEGLPEKSKWAMEEIEKVCGGRFVFHGGGKVTFKTAKSQYSANSIAEGFRKIGMLSRLLETGALKPGSSGPLFWDEPEANLNPRLLKLLVQILLELSRNGQQIILATHDYVLLKWFDLLMDKDLDDDVRFHTLCHDAEFGDVSVNSVDEYQNIGPNAIASTFSDLYDSEINRSLGGTKQ